MVAKKLNPGSPSSRNILRSVWTRPDLLHLVFLALDDYRKETGDLPAAHDAAAADKIVQLTNAAKAKTSADVDIDEALVKKVARTAGAVLAPMCSIFGGIVGQEVSKAVSNKHHPVYQFVYLDAVEMLPDYDSMMAEELQPTGSRYDAQISVLGRSFQGKLGAQKIFMVGCGALGCELFKNFAMMGVSCGKDGLVTVTDDDVIEKSNLSRQFLFRNYNVQQSKSMSATKAIQNMNPSIHVQANQDRVSPNTEAVYNDDFWQGLDCVVNALDNVKARQYVDARCVFFGKALFESGTMGTKCNVQCVIPHKTIPYGGRKDPETKEAPECALHNFPHNINHCLSLGRSEFVGMFDTKAGETAKFLENPNFVQDLSSKIWAEDGSEMPDAQAKAKEANEVLEAVVEYTTGGLVKSFEECVVWARLKFEEYFSNKIKQLVFSCPEDMRNASGAPFWSPPKRFPSVITFDETDPMHMNFIIAAANLKAQIYNVPGYKPQRDPAAFKAILASVVVPEFVPKSGVKIETGEKKEGAPEAPPAEDLSVLEMAKALLGKLPAPSSLGGLKVTSLEFEKDDDTNFHMDFISSFANLRARNYSIEEVQTCVFCSHDASVSSCDACS
jgi:ubiquitin-activating enzyme E1